MNLPLGKLWPLVLVVAVVVAVPFVCGQSEEYDSPADRERALGERVTELVNEERTERGLEPVEYDPELSAFASDHSAWMAETRIYSHEGPDGGPAARAKAAGLSCYPSENIAALDRSDRYSVDHTAREVVESWMRSPGHRWNILDEDASRMGIGAGHEFGTDLFVTQNFC